MKVAELQEENQKQRMKMRDMQNKLETAMMEIRKNQNLAVPKSPKKTSNSPNTDSNSISVQDSTTPARVAETDALHVPLAKDDSEKPQKQNSSSSLSLSPSIASSPEKFNVKELEDLLAALAAGDRAGCEKILSRFQILRKEHQMQSAKIIKLKSEQMKACEIIKNMMESRNKANDEINQLKEHVKQLEHELESVVTKPTSDAEDGVSLKQKITELNIKAAVMSKSEDEVDIRKRVCNKVAMVRPERYQRRTK